MDVESLSSAGWGNVLDGVRVVEIGHMVAGPSCSLFLADLGAEVVKIEGTSGDVTRKLGPLLGDDVSAMFAAVNSNKKSVALDLRDEEARRAAHALLRTADVMVSNLDATLLSSWGFAYEDVTKDNPGLIAVEVSAYGPGGPPGTDSLVQASEGLMNLTGPQQGPGFRAGASVIDVATGLWSAFAVLAALRRRDAASDPIGERITVSLADVCLSLQLHHLAMFAGDPSSVQRNGNHSTVACTPVIEAADGRVCTVVLHDRHWSAFVKAMGVEHLRDDERFANARVRVENQGALEEELRATTIQQPREHWVRALREHRLPCAPERPYGEVLEDLNHRRKGTFFEVPAPGGQSLQVALPIRVGDAPPTTDRQPAPHRGQHTAEVLTDLGVDSTLIAKLSGLDQS